MVEKFQRQLQDENIKMEEFKQKTDVHGGSRNSNRGVGQFSGNKSFKFTPFVR